MSTSDHTPTALSQSESSSVSSKSIKHLFRGTVSSSERHIIQQHILDAETELRNYQAEINRLRAKIAVFETKTVGVELRIQRCRSLLSPVHRMPQEILVEIFLCCSEGEVLEPGKVPIPGILFKVCGRWREIALSTSRLWACISLDLSTWIDVMGGAGQLKALMASFMQRSRMTPLTVSLDSLGISPEAQERFDALIGALQSLLDNSSRWRHLECTQPLLLLPAFQNMRSRLPSLKSLRVTSDDENISDSDPLFLECSSLNSLSITPDYWAPSDLPLRCIKSLHLRHSYAPSALSIVRACTNAHEIVMDLIGGSDEEDFEPDHIILPNVQSLTVIAECDDDATTIFHASTMQSLSALNVRRTTESKISWQYWNLAPVRNFLARSSYSVTSLRLERLPLSDGGAISLLRLTPALRSLAIAEYEQGSENKIVTPAFLALLFVIDDDLSSSFLTSLSDIDLAVHFGSLDIQSLTNVVASRADGTAPRSAPTTCLRSLTLTVMAKEQPDMELFSALRCFKDAGVRVDISHKAI